ncbi:nucleotidyltransferase family protein [Sphingobacterium detergens]|uniref:nucleotidyltransferase family protein n=1 Tax=Sphingobacterium detergens TaxID=1145106 RepID=UPI003AB06C20
MENDLKSIFFQLLNIGLWGEGSLQLSKPLNEENWSQIYSLAVNHTVEGLIFDSFSFLKEEQLPPQAIRLKWAVRIDKIEKHSSKMNAVIAKQSQAFREQKLSLVLQKGQGVAFCYRIPQHRVSGDIDWYFEEKSYAKARNILKEKMLNFQDTAGFSLSYECDGITVEHHKKLFDIQSPLKKRFLKQIQQEYKSKQQIIVINNVPVNILAPELQLLQVNAHILKHLLSFGIGFRQLCDSARLYYSLDNQFDKVSLYRLYKNAGILKWIHLLHYILIKYLGMPQKCLPFSIPDGIDADWMFDEIWYSGNFGFHDKRFEGGKIVPLISVQPDGALRLWHNFNRYLKYAPQEAIFFPLVHIYSKFFGKDRH